MLQKKVKKAEIKFKKNKYWKKCVRCDQSDAWTQTVEWNEETVLNIKFVLYWKGNDHFSLRVGKIEEWTDLCMWSFKAVYTGEFIHIVLYTLFFVLFLLLLTIVLIIDVFICSIFMF